MPLHKKVNKKALLRECQFLRQKIGDMEAELKDKQVLLMHSMDASKIGEIVNKYGKTIYIKPEPYIWKDQEIDKLFKDPKVIQKARKVKIISNKDDILKKVRPEKITTSMDMAFIAECLQQGVITKKQYQSLYTLGEGTAHLRFYDA